MQAPQAQVREEMARKVSGITLLMSPLLLASFPGAPGNEATLSCIHKLRSIYKYRYFYFKMSIFGADQVGYLYLWGMYYTTGLNILQCKHSHNDAVVPMKLPLE